MILLSEARPLYKEGGDVKSTANNNKKMYHGTRHNYYGNYYTDMVDENGNPLAFNYYDKDGRAHYINRATGETYTSYKGDYDEGGVTIKPSTYRSSYDPNGINDFMNIATLGILNRLSPSQDLGIIRDIANNRGALDIINRSILGNDGIFNNPNKNLALDIISPALAYGTYKLPSLLRNYSLGVPNKAGRYFRIVGNASTPQGDAIADANATGIIRSNAKRVNVVQSKSGRRFTFGKEYSYPMFSKDKVWQGSTGIGESLGKTDRIIRTKADTGPTVWEESRIDFNHKNHAGIFRPNYLGDINAFPTRYAEWWERIGNNPITRHIWKRHDFDNVEFRNGGSIARPQYKKDRGFYLWSKLLANKWHEPVSNIVNDKSYNYRAYYNENLIDAYKHLIGQGHFPDTYKTVYHPTFSIESRYSGYKNKYNPNGITGGRWFDANTPVGQQNIYQFSSSQLNNNWNIDRTLQYIDNAEDNGVLPLLPNGRMLHLDGTLYGGVLPSVIVRPRKNNGGGIHINPANRGKFTATMKRTGKTAEELSHSSNPLTRKRAIFCT